MDAKKKSSRRAMASNKMRNAVEQYLGRYGWGGVSVGAFIVVALCILFVPHVMGPVHQPPMSILLIFPLLMAVIFLYFSYASKIAD